VNHTQSPIILALDTDDLDVAKSWIEATGPAIDVFKVGLEFFLNFGSAGINELKSAGDFELFLDLKLHDIPNTVAGAVRGIKELSPKFLTVHAAGGSAMIQSAADEAGPTKITAVTVLTSLNQDDLTSMGIELTPLDYAQSLARNAVKAGAEAIVCSPHEVAAIRSIVPAEINLITPGVRPEGSALGDQARVMTPSTAIAAGSDYLVVGRPITSLYDGSEASIKKMGAKAQEILDSIG
jgi:orotidine-5'-phosphate decarboxylase